MKDFPKVIGFTGLAGAGKSTAAMAIVTTYQDFSRFSLADPIRAMLLALGMSGADFTHEHKEQPSRLLGGVSPRRAMQTLGTEWGRQLIGPDVWLNASRRRLLHVLDMGNRAVFDDIRFDNEARFIREDGGLIISLSRPDAAPAMAHPSEGGVSPELVDHHIEARDVDDLRSKLFAYLNNFAAY